MDEEVIISPQIDEGMMQIDIESFTKDPDSVEDNDNEVKGELLDSIASEGETTAASLEPYEGMEFESEEAARAFYSAYARRVGFRVRISRYTRSRRDNSIISRLIVCSKEGFREPRGGGGGCFGGERKQQRQRAVTRVGCKAMLMVKKLGDGKWAVSRFVKDHNHGPVPPRKLEVGVVRKEADEDSTVAEEPIAALTDGGEVQEPIEGMEFDSEEDARGFYINYARQMGFQARISKYCRSRRDNSIISRQIVCSKEGFREVRIKKEDADDGRAKRPRVVTRIGCKATIVVKKANTGKWVVSRFEREHNHALGTSNKDPLLLQSSNDDSAAEKGLVTHVRGGDGTLGTSREPLTVLYNRLCGEAIRFAQEGAVSEEIYNVAMAALKEAVEKVTAAKRSAAVVAQGVNGGHGSCITKCPNEAKKAVSGNKLVVMQQPVKFVLIPSASLANDSKPANHSVESPMVLSIPNGQGISIPNPISVLKQSSTISQSVKGLVGNGATEHMGAVQNSQKLDNIGVSKLKTTGGNGSSLATAGASEEQTVAYPALPVTLYMPVMGSLSESSSGTAGSNAYTLVAAPVEASPVTTSAPSQVNVQQSTAPVKDRKDQTPWSYTGPNPQVHATAIAAGARIIPPQEAASLIRAIHARIRNSKPALISGCMQLSASVAQNPLSCNNMEAGPKPLSPANKHAEAIGGQEQASSEEMRLHEPGEGLKEMDVAMMEHSAVYDSACDDHLFSDAGS